MVGFAKYVASQTYPEIPPKKTIKHEKFNENQLNIKENSKEIQ